MSEKMYPIPFRSLMNWILAEREKTGEGLRRAQALDRRPGQDASHLR